MGEGLPLGVESQDCSIDATCALGFHQRRFRLYTKEIMAMAEQALSLSFGKGSRSRGGLINF
jgi:hypothetical protein